MSRSSGQTAYTRDEEHTCTICDWSGWVEVVIDPEINLHAWYCPGCAEEHEEEWP